MAQTVDDSPPTSTRIGIVGGGIAGLYTALLLMREGYHNFHIFEGSGRIGGRVDTRLFCNEKDQYFEAGAMRIPDSPFHRITFNLINWLNRNVDSNRNIELIKYIMSHSGNDFHLNGELRRGLHGKSNTITPKSLDWDVPDGWKDKNLEDLMKDAIGGFLEELRKAAEKGKEAFDQVYQKIIDNYDHLSFRTFLLREMHYPGQVVDFMETVLTQSNQFALSVPATLVQNLDFGTTEWKTINQGMSRLPRAMGAFIGHNKITYGARVRRVEEVTVEGIKKVKVTATGYRGVIKLDFEKVVLAIPPAALKMIVARPRWSPAKQMAIRSAHIVPLYKMGLRFKRRFWEQIKSNGDGLTSSEGGQSTTDLPIRWIVFPSYGIGGTTEGVLVVYAWMTDATSWLPLTPVERVTLAINNLETVYKGRLGEENGSDVKIADLLIETMDVVWAEKNSTGDAFGLPHQLSQHMAASRKPEWEEKIYFAGEHLSFHHTWISGAADSALLVTRQLLKRNEIKELTEEDKFESKQSDLFNFKFTPADPLFLLDSDSPEFFSDNKQLPGTLGDGTVHCVGPEVTHLRGVY